MLHALFLKYSSDKLQQYSGRIQDCLARLSAEQIWTRNTSNENAIGNLVLHLCGNLRQWIVSGVAGQPDIRERDAEFAARAGEEEELCEGLSATIRDAVAVISGLREAQLEEKRVIQNYEVTVFEAVYHVVEHFAGHTGQIIFATKLLTGSDLGYYTHLSKAAIAPKSLFKVP